MRPRRGCAPVPGCTGCGAQRLGTADCALFANLLHSFNLTSSTRCHVQPCHRFLPPKNQRRAAVLRPKPRPVRAQRGGGRPARADAPRGCARASRARSRRHMCRRLWPPASPVGKLVALAPGGGGPGRWWLLAQAAQRQPKCCRAAACGGPAQRARPEAGGSSHHPPFPATTAWWPRPWPQQVSKIPAPRRKPTAAPAPVPGAGQALLDRPGPVRIPHRPGHAGKASPLFGEQTLVARQTWTPGTTPPCTPTNLARRWPSRWRTWARWPATSSTSSTDLPDLLADNQYKWNKEMLSRTAEVEDLMAGITARIARAGPPVQAHGAAHVSSRRRQWVKLPD